MSELKGNRGYLMDWLRSIGIENPERHCLELPDAAIVGVKRWYEFSTKRGEKIGGGLVITKLRDGGMEGFGTRVEGPNEWWRSREGRTKWLLGNDWKDQTPEIEFAEAAVITLVAERKEPTPELVRSYALTAQRSQQAYDVKCQEDAAKRQAPDEEFVRRQRAKWKPIDIDVKDGFHKLNAKGELA